MAADQDQQRNCVPQVSGEDVTATEPFHTFDHHGNEYVIEHGNVPTDQPTPVVLWPLALWRPYRECGLRHTGPCPAEYGRDAGAPNGSSGARS